MNNWYVVHTQPNGESKASSHLRRQGFEVYLPCGRRWRSHARRRELVLRPLFPRYLFVRFDAETARWRAIFSTVGVSNLICEGDRPLAVPQPVIAGIQEAEASGSFDDALAASRLKPGDAIRIVRGPFADLIGQLQSLVSGDRVKVLLDILGRQVPTMVEAAEVAPA
ncbi:MAG TPA: transcription termination/antitermination NusG family protein [Xanthobacteraceae bacterium]|nr:transcription termination/antitermination NusG family protein [Xanthobacteraceae bacterium]